MNASLRCCYSRISDFLQVYFYIVFSSPVVTYWYLYLEETAELYIPNEYMT